MPTQFGGLDEANSFVSLLQDRSGHEICCHVHYGDERRASGIIQAREQSVGEPTCFLISAFIRPYLRCRDATK
jgi:hypothetical protein